MTTQTVDPQRITIITRDENAVRHENFVSWDSDQVRIAKTISREWRHKLSDPSQPWEVEHVEQRDGYDSLAVKYLLSMVGRSLSTHHSRIRVESLSSYASVLWDYEAVPSRFPTSESPCTGWWAVENGKDVAHGDLPGSVTPSSHSSQSSGASPSWCWHSQPRYGSAELSLKLVNIALVFGWRDVLRREIKTVIWNWPNVTAAELTTPVEVLKKEGIHGLAKLRSDELDKVYRHIHNYIIKHKGQSSSSASKAEEKLSANVNNITQAGQANVNIYQFVKQVEDSFPRLFDTSGSSSSSTRSIAAMSTSTGGDYRPGGGGGVVALAMRLRQWAEAISGSTDLRKFAKEMLDDTHRFIEERQNAIADELLTWRNIKVAEWEKRLDNGRASLGSSATSVVA